MDFAVVEDLHGGAVAVGDAGLGINAAGEDQGRKCEHADPLA